MKIFKCLSVAVLLGFAQQSFGMFKAGRALCARLGAVKVGTLAAASITAKKLTDHDMQALKTEVGNLVDGAVEFQKFTKKYAPPKEIAAAVENDKDAISNSRFDSIFPLIKNSSIRAKDNNINRIINAERMRECIRQNNLHRLAVPKKYIHKVDNKWIVLAENIEYEERKRALTLEEVQQLAILAKETGYNDWGFYRSLENSNTFIDKHTQKLTFIDTENRSFRGESPCVSLEQLKWNGQTLIAGDAATWLDKQVYDTCNSPEGNTERSELSFSTEFDKQGINFKKVKQHYQHQGHA